jgi:hypothetical protein
VATQFDLGFECSVCADLLVQGKIICENGHTICNSCYVHINGKKASCPFCRNNLLQKPINNLHLEEIIKIHYPKRYSEKIIEMGSQSLTWQHDPMFNGDFIFYD